ncbi:MAG TPA: DUF2169 domain-containing protein, partial [Polyangia bacterium]
MSFLANVTGLPVAPSVGRDERGQMQLTVAIKASFTWGKDGAPIPAEPIGIVEEDLFVGEPGKSGIARPAEVGPPKPRVDVLLVGAFLFSQPIMEADVALSVGGRLRKGAKVYGDRYWLPSPNGGVVPSRPRPVARLPILWERSFGGSDPADSTCFEPRNPVGSGIAKRSKTLEAQPAPSFEEPQQRIRTAKDRPIPWGFGAIAPHWQPRVKLAGTYDQKWQKERCPLLPPDFNRAYFNVAPMDQQLDGYIAGEEVRLDGMTVMGQERFKLPVFRTPIIFRSRSEMFETFAQVDTIVIEPAERRFSLVARAAYSPRPNMLAMRQVLIGPASRGRRRAIETGKEYLKL